MRKGFCGLGGGIIEVRRKKREIEVRYMGFLVW